MGFLIDLGADVCDLRGGGGIEDVSDIVDVAGRLEVFDLLGLALLNEEQHGENAEQKNQKRRRKVRPSAPVHSKIVQEYAKGVFAQNCISRCGDCKAASFLG